jgi:L-threonylcarbamoyladenylate synthase
MVDFESDIKNCVNTLQQGGVILYPTDTVWGLGCNALDAAAVEKVFALKQRPKEKSMIVLLADARDILQFVAAPPPDIIAIVESFTEPTTVIYDGAIGFPDNVVNADGSIAIRVTTDPFCKALIKRFRNPIVSTSANISGAPPPAIFSLIDQHIIDGADYAVSYRQEDATRRAPSRLVRVSDEGEVTVVVSRK